MKVKKTFISFFLFIFLLYCPAEPAPTFMGYPIDPAMGNINLLFLLCLFCDNGVGSVMDRANALEWKKCSQGQVYLAISNNCQGNQSHSSRPYGAHLLAYCDIDGNDCNTLSPPYALTKPTSGHSSEAFISCENDRLHGYSDWRLPTPYELTALTQSSIGSKIVFPDSVYDNYWSAWSNIQDKSGGTAIGISFKPAEFGAIKYLSKTSREYVRCVRNN